jgi:hypothetical protein
MTLSELMTAFLASNLPTCLTAVLAVVLSQVAFFMVVKMTKWIQGPETIDQKITRKREKWGRYGAGDSGRSLFGD